MSRTTTQPDQQAQIAALVAAQGAARASLTAQAQAQAAVAAQDFGGWYDSAAITVWALELAAQMEALQRAAAQTADAYLSRVLTLLTGRKVRPVGRVDITDLRNGTITHAGAYARAADAYRWQQAQFDASVRSLLDLSLTPTPFELGSPEKAAVGRVLSVADMDIQLADRAQTTAVYDAHGERGTVTGYRRVIHPELSRGGTCGLCIAASDRLYGVREPKPIHARCHCTTLPVLEGQDPGSTLNAGDLTRLYREAGATSAAKLKATRYQLDEHGELGPVLSRRGTPFRTERQAKRDQNRPTAPKSAAEKVVQLRRVRDGLAPALPRARELAAEDPKTWGDYLTKLEARIRDLDQQLAA